ncbi:hypothetical protein HHK36_023612 [Tetracentron sinense]|uniref:HTH myb-type domain-containing protein n=1 Tax=Tetracentron sinense TaxID=13715 RepID=A0A835D5D6_TETSI|nr:hypothetical protein HHK36_023612 [Tetracentron sinense]
MLAVSPLRNPRDDKEGGKENFPVGTTDDFPDFASGNLLDGIDFDDLFIGTGEYGELFQDLDLDPEMLAQFSVSGGEESEIKLKGTGRREEEDKASASGSGSNSSQGDEIVSKRDELVVVNPSRREIDKGRKSSMQSKGSQGKRKVKVDWTPELHRRFVQAVEQLGVDKAVPSRILELMGIDCLTRHNIASHLQVTSETFASTRGGGGELEPETANVSNPLPPGTPCFPPLVPTTVATCSFYIRFAPPLHVPGIPPHAMYKLDYGIGVPTGKPDSHPPLIDFLPSKESVDAAIGDFLSKPFLPLPLGLKPPSLESVLGELQRQGVPKIPPSCA